MKKALKYFLIAMVLLHVFLGMWWLAVSWALALGILWLCTSLSTAAVKFRRCTLLSYPLLIIGSVVAAIFFKTLFFGIYKIPSGSMENTISPGDVVWVNNLAYGPRLPYSPYEISWANVLIWLWEGKEGDVKKRWWKYKRLKGYASPKNGQVAVFNHPKSGVIFIKRIAAIPGDTLQIIEGTLYINGQRKEAPSKSIFYSKALFSHAREGKAILDSLNISMFQQNSTHDTFKFNGQLTHSDLERLRRHPKVIEAGIDPLRPDTAWTVYPRSKALNWNIDNYGPYILPYRGMAIEKNAYNLSLYRRLIKKEVQDGAKGDRGDSGVFIFEHDYYFLMGDNFHDSQDSRYFGPVREEFLIGKASFIVFSKARKHASRFRL
jgi:signal peptidase I